MRLNSRSPAVALKREGSVMADAEIIIIDDRTLKDKLHLIRGEQVMLDFDLAEIYGYSVSAFNQQVKRNIDRFPNDFMFQLTKLEFENLMSQNVISSWGGRRKLPYAFTEQGIYMLMTVLKGSSAIEQSKTLIRLFKSMKDYIIQNQQLLITQSDYMTLARLVSKNTNDIEAIEQKMITKAELSDFMKLFDKGVQSEEVLILDGQPFSADIAYQEIYQSARESIIIIDDYIGTKTLQHLVHAKTGVRITIVSDNKLKLLKLSEYNDFLTEYPRKTVNFIKSQKRVHDRYIVLDNNTSGMKIYLCGASSKDAGKRITTISRLMDVDALRNVVNELLANPPLLLK